MILATILFIVWLATSNGMFLVLAVLAFILGD